MGIKSFLKGIKSGQKKYGESISAIINSVLLSVVYIVGVGVTSVFAKVLGKHFLDLNFKKPQDTYWEELNLGREDLEKYYRQF